MKCELNHGFVLEQPEAVDFLCQKFISFELNIPICKECAITLTYSKDWVLLFCVTCLNSQWVYLPNSKNNHLYNEDEKIKWMEDGCPKCTQRG
jgi:hypothetical protein